MLLSFFVASMLLSKRFQEPGVFPVFLRMSRHCCVHVASQNVSRNGSFPGQKPAAPLQTQMICTSSDVVLN